MRETQPATRTARAFFQSSECSQAGLDQAATANPLREMLYYRHRKHLTTGDFNVFYG